jgi:hypothetical protein
LGRAAPELFGRDHALASLLELDGVRIFETLGRNI